MAPPRRRIDVQCAHCGCPNEVQVAKARNNKSNLFFCDRACRAAHSCGASNPLYRDGPIVVSCAHCELTISRARNKLKEKNFCSKACWYAWRGRHIRGEKATRFSGGGLEIVCIQCGCAKRVPKYAADRAKFCSRQCRSIWCGSRYRGEAHPNYKARVSVACRSCGDTHLVHTSEAWRLRCPACLARQRAYLMNLTSAERRLRHRLRNRVGQNMRNALAAGKAGRSWEHILGYSYRALRRHLNRTMPDGYTWDDIAELHIDHIDAVKHFRFTSPDDPDFARCWALSNLRLLPKAENLRKNARLVRPFQPLLI